MPRTSRGNPEGRKGVPPPLNLVQTIKKKIIGVEKVTKIEQRNVFLNLSVLRSARFEKFPPPKSPPGSALIGPTLAVFIIIIFIKPKNYSRVKKIPATLNLLTKSKPVGLSKFFNLSIVFLSAKQNMSYVTKHDKTQL